MTHPAGIWLSLCSFCLRTLWHQCQLTVASAPHDYSLCVQTVVSQRVVICSSTPAEPPSNLWIMLDLARSTANLLAHF